MNGNTQHTPIDQRMEELDAGNLGARLALALADIRPRQVATLSLIAPAGLGPEIDAAAPQVEAAFQRGLNRGFAGVYLLLGGACVIALGALTLVGRPRA